MRPITFIVLGLSIVFGSYAAANEIPEGNFKATCTIKDGKNVSYRPSSGATYTGETTNSPDGRLKIAFEYALAKNGKVYGYTDLTPVGFSNTETFGGQMIDASPLVSDKFFTVSSSVEDRSITLRRAYKNEWYGLLVANDFQTDESTKQDSYITFVYPLDCRSDNITK
jgi:hypothetical protein